VAQLTAKEKAILKKLLAEEADEIEEAGDEAEEEEAPRGRRRKPAVRASASGAGDGDVFVLRGESAKTFLSSLGVGGDPEQGEDEDQEEAEDGGEEGEPKGEPTPKSRSRYFRG
jgi:hypothetical protein